MTDTTNPLLDTRALPRFAEITADHIAPALDDALARHAATIETLVRDKPVTFADAWLPFEPWLGPLKAALGDVLTAYPAAPASV